MSTRLSAIFYLVSTPADRATEFGDALVREIRAEMARHDIGSVRALAQLVGMNHASLNDRLNRSSRTGERVAIGMEDLVRICSVLDVEPWELMRRTARVVQKRHQRPASQQEIV